MRGQPQEKEWFIGEWVQSSRMTAILEKAGQSVSVGGGGAVICNCENDWGWQRVEAAF